MYECVGDWFLSLTSNNELRSLWLCTLITGLNEIYELFNLLAELRLDPALGTWFGWYLSSIIYLSVYVRVIVHLRLCLFFIWLCKCEHPAGKAKTSSRFGGVFLILIGEDCYFWSWFYFWIALKVVKYEFFFFFFFLNGVTTLVRKVSFRWLDPLQVQI